MDSIELLARFSYMPNKLKLCGGKIGNLLREFVAKDGLNKSLVTVALLDFPALPPYLETIFERSGKNFSGKKYWNDYETVEAYCLGNTLLEQVVVDEDWISLLINKYAQKKSWNQAVIDASIKMAPVGCVPHHSFHVLYLTASGGVPSEAELNGMDNCLIRWGTVEEIYDRKIKVVTRHLEYDGEFKLGGFSIDEVNFDDKMVNDVNVGDVVALHWGLAFMKLDKRQHNNLRYYTDKNMCAINRHNENKFYSSL